MRLKLALVTVLVAAPTAAFAQGVGSVQYTPNLDPDRFVFTADPNSVALTESARPMGYLDYSLALALRAGAPPLQVCARDGAGNCAASGNIVSSRFGADLVGTIGLGRVGLYGQLPVVLHQGSDFDVRKGSELTVGGMGDLRLGAKVLLYGEPENALAIDVRGVLPTGSGDFTSDGGVSIENRLLYEHRQGRGALALGAGYAWRQKGAKLGNLFVDDEILWSAGVEYAVKPNKVSLGVSVFGRIGVMSDPDPMDGFAASPGWEERPIEALGTARLWATKEIVLEAGAGAGLDGGYGAPAFRALLGLRYFHVTPEDPDRDRDGILNVVDSCPDVPEDFDRFEDTDGCPDPDNDKDTILDTVDHCPNDPEDFDKFEDVDGCPDPDNDKDGILDVVDKCPDDPEDKDGFEDADGCPDPDNDKDGILDTADKCPDIPEDKDGFEDEDGCPDLDNDNDKILDVDDKCPNEPETINGIDDEDGCPDAKVVVTTTAIEIKDEIYFDLDKATIKPVSFLILNDVATAMKEHPTLRISVEGHTDDRADDKYNLKLSQRRAEAVRTYLIKKGGIAKDRLTATGFGETRPKVPGTTKEARDQNRRVEFIIIKPPAPPAPPPATPPPAPATN